VGTISEHEADNIRFFAFDYIPLEDWCNGICETSYEERHWKLWSERDAIPFNMYIVEYKIVNDLSGAENLYLDMIDKGKEGIIIKNIKSAWKPHRSPNQVKMKESLEIDLKIVEVVEGTGKYEGMLGKFECENSDGTIKVGVGTGYDDEDRKRLFKKSMVGKIITVKYNAIIDRKTDDTKSLFLPVFVELRLDKEESD
jgi:DNA ligase-1